MDDRSWEIFCEVMQALPRQGPGNAESLTRTLALCKDLPANPSIIDLGCGSGGQTIDLVKAVGGHAVAVDIHEPNIARMRERVANAGLLGQIEAIVADMMALDVPAQSFDLVWSEGALYNLGLDVALPICRGLLKPNGYLVFSEAIWLTDHPAALVQAAFADYPAMGDIDTVLSKLDQSDFDDVGHFVLPEAAWWDDFYTPMLAEIDRQRSIYVDDPQALAVLDEIAKEPEVRREHAADFGYGFFVARKR